MWGHYFLIKLVLCRVRPSKASSPGVRLTSTQATSPREVGYKPAAPQTHTQFCRREEAAVGARQDGNNHFNEIEKAAPRSSWEKRYKTGGLASSKLGRAKRAFREMPSSHQIHGLIRILIQAD